MEYAVPPRVFECRGIIVRAGGISYGRITQRLGKVEKAKGLVAFEKTIVAARTDPFGDIGPDDCHRVRRFQHPLVNSIMAGCST